MFEILRKPKEVIHPSGSPLRSAAVKPSFIRWRTVLVWFVRIVALLWLMKGLAAWAMIFGVLGPDHEFLLQNMDYQSAVVYFAVVDLIAAIGLWMVSAWGGVVWLIAVVSYIAISNLFNEIAVTNSAVSWGFGALIVCYCALSWLARRDDVR